MTFFNYKMLIFNTLDNFSPQFLSMRKKLCKGIFFCPYNQGIRAERHSVYDIVIFQRRKEQFQTKNCIIEQGLMI